MKRIDPRKATVVVLILISLLSSIFIVVGAFDRFLGGEDSSAIYNGNLEYGYPYMGYMKLNGSATINCGLTYVSSTVALTAAHCVYPVSTPNIKPYFGNNTSSSASFNVTNKVIKPGYNYILDGYGVYLNDLAVLQISDASAVGTFAQVVAPSVGCNYYVVGYGRYDAAGNLGIKRGEDVCIDNLDNNTIFFRQVRSDTGICPGDSGSGIFVKGTNQLVGVVSARTSSAPVCGTNTVQYGVRLDTSASFLSPYVNISDNNDPPPPTVAPTSSCPGQLDAQFWLNCPGEEYAGCAGLSGWISGSDLTSRNPKVGDTLDVNCFANNGGVFENSRAELYHNGTLIQSGNNSIKDYLLTKEGQYYARCVKQSDSSCSSPNDYFTVASTGNACENSNVQFNFSYNGNTYNNRSTGPIIFTGPSINFNSNNCRASSGNWNLGVFDRSPSSGNAKLLFSISNASNKNNEESSYIDSEVAANNSGQIFNNLYVSCYNGSNYCNELRMVRALDTITPIPTVTISPTVSITNQPTQVPTVAPTSNPTIQPTNTPIIISTNTPVPTQSQINTPTPTAIGGSFNPTISNGGNSNPPISVGNPLPITSINSNSLKVMVLGIFMCVVGLKILFEINKKGEK